jgi:hypothetical protein
MIEQLKERVNSNERLLHRGRFVNTTFLLEVGADAWLIQIIAGRVANVASGPFVMPRWTFALRAPQEAWMKFWSHAPQPGFHDVFALIKQRLLRVEGDMHPFMANLFYFKGVLESLRDQS